LPYRSRISPNQRIAGQQRNSLDHRLSDQDAVEWILVDRWEKIDSERMITGHCQFAVAAVDQASA
jgi:hypothetical protein